MGRMGGMGGGLDGEVRGKKGAAEGEQGVMQVVGSVHLMKRGAFRGEREEKTSYHDGYIFSNLIFHCLFFRRGVRPFHLSSSVVEQSSIPPGTQSSSKSSYTLILLLYTLILPPAPNPTQHTHTRNAY